MKSIRRLYFYAVTFVAVEVILWGLIALLRETLAAGILPDAGLLSSGLAAVIVALPFFLIHWLAAQGFARRDEEERESTLRAVFLYGILLATGIPAVQNVLALMNRLLLTLFHLEVSLAVVGGYQNWADNLIALVVNLGAGYYFLRALNANRATLTEREHFDGVARLARYIWIVYGLGLLVFGLQQILVFLLTPGTGGPIPVAASQRPLINGLVLTLVGAPLWVYFWRAAQSMLGEPAEARSMLRLGVLYLLAIGAAVVTLISAGNVLQALLELALGARPPFADLLADIRTPLTLVVPFALVWAYHAHWLSVAFKTYPEESRRPGLRRFYYYILALLGLGALTGGVAAVVNTLLDMLFYIPGLHSLLAQVMYRGSLAGGLAAVLIGLPLWLLTWRPMQAEALALEGEPARRSLVRRAYLYLALFAAVIGIMVSAVMLVYQLIMLALDRSAFDAGTVRDVVPLLAIFAVVLWYHWACLRRDAAHAAALPAVKAPDFPVLALDPGDPAWCASLTAALRKQAPDLPVTFRPAAEPGKADARAVLLPAALALDPPEPLRRWLKDFPGARIVVPGPAAGWVWPGADPRRGPDSAVAALRALSQGETPRPSGGASAWQIVAYVFAALFATELLFLLFTLFISALSL